MERRECSTIYGERAEGGEEFTSSPNESSPPTIECRCREGLLPLSSGHCLNVRRKEAGPRFRLPQLCRPLSAIVGYCRAMSELVECCREACRIQHALPRHVASRVLITGVA
ncbi:hypothetical protein RRG08_001606 [Elysia crispata]|uniref:Uncharacterized protein n=1 Tax=Elysia crispata TaxID=231223 RepID=A0AAE1AL90_9GAST|nr:hypothetical protein RRG08_001606 [Elysia crispata]